MIGGCQI